MKNTVKIIFVGLFGLLINFQVSAQEVKYKCMQLRWTRSLCGGFAD